MPPDANSNGVPQAVDMFGRLREKLGAAQRSLGQGLEELLLGRRTLDSDLLDDLETLLLSADVGVETTRALIDGISLRLARHELADNRAAYRLLRQEILAIIQPHGVPLQVSRGMRPFIIMTVGVNGVGKTTTIAKLAWNFKHAGHRVMLAAADTFRAAAIEQIQAWGERIGVPVIAQRLGADAAAVAHDAVTAAQARGCDVLIVDTAGRQHTHGALMDELKKIKRVASNIDPTAPHEVLLVLDGGTGQNALSQLEHFNIAVGVTGLCVTKLDGTAKGGILIAISRKTNAPIRYIGVGESKDDLREFDAREYLAVLLPEEQ